MDRLTPSGVGWAALGQTPVAGPPSSACWGLEYLAGGGAGAVGYLPVPTYYSTDPAPTAAQRLIYTAPYA